MTDTHHQGPSPEAELLRQRREAMAVSPERLSHLLANLGVKLSGRRIRELEVGKAKGEPTAARPEGLVGLARVLGISPEELEGVGREDAAVALREHVDRRAVEDPAIAALVEKTSPGLPASHSAHIMQVVFQGIDDIRQAKNLSREQKDKLEQSYLQTLTSGVEAGHAQLTETLRIFNEDSA